MAVLKQISFYQNRRDEVPNQELARKLARTADKPGIREVADNLTNKNRAIQSDCLKVLYEIGYLKPRLIAPYVKDFLGLLAEKNNRMVWGAMIALASIAEIRHEEIWNQVDNVVAAIDNGTLITLVWGIRTLARAASMSSRRTKIILPKLQTYLRTCKARDVPTHLESMLPVIDGMSWPALKQTVEARRTEMAASHLSRLKKVLKQIPESRVSETDKAKKGP